MKVQFVHGLESSPQGNKARLFAAHYDARTPAMDTSDFEGCVSVQAEAAKVFSPDVLVGSSFGGGVALAMLQRGLWKGPTLLLAQAGVLRGLPAELPAEIPMTIVHGTRDTIVDPAGSRQLAAAGDPAWVQLLEVDDDHPLSASLEDGSLLRWVEELAGRAQRS